MFGQVWTEGTHSVILGLGLSLLVYLSPWAGTFSGVSLFFPPPYVKREGSGGLEFAHFPYPESSKASPLLGKPLLWRILLASFKIVLSCLSLAQQEAICSPRLSRKAVKDSRGKHHDCGGGGYLRWGPQEFHLSS